MDQFIDRNGRPCSYEQWQGLQKSSGYNLVDLTRVGQVLIFTEWIGIHKTGWRTYTINLQAERIHAPLWSHSEAAALEVHKKAVQTAIRNDPDYTSQKAKEICVLCGSNMRPLQSKHGVFFGCSQWKQTGCPCTVSKDGQLSKKTLEVLNQAIQPQETQEVIDPALERIANIDLD